MFLFPWFLRYRHITTIPNPFLLVLKQLFRCPVLKISEAQFEVGQWDIENLYEISLWLCFAFTGTCVHVMSSKTIIVTLEGNKGRKADHQVGREKPDLQIFAQRYFSRLGLKTIGRAQTGRTAVPISCCALKVHSKSELGCCLRNDLWGMFSMCSIPGSCIPLSITNPQYRNTSWPMQGTCWQLLFATWLPESSLPGRGFRQECGSSGGSTIFGQGKEKSDVAMDSSLMRNG